LLAGEHPRGSGSPEMADLGLPGPILDGIRPWRMLATCVIHLDSWHRSAGVATARATAWAARVSKARRRVRVPVPTVAYDPRRLALKVRGEDVVLTKVRNGLERGSVVTSMADRRQRRSEFMGGAAAEGLRAPDHRYVESCEGARGIREVRGSSATKNCGGGAAQRQQLRYEFPTMQKRRIQLLGSGNFWMARGSGCGGCRGLWHGGAAAQRRGRKGNTAEPRGWRR
jgi:hypothetical protein